MEKDGRSTVCGMRYDTSIGGHHGHHRLSKCCCKRCGVGQLDRQAPHHLLHLHEGVGGAVDGIVGDDEQGGGGGGCGGGRGSGRVETGVLTVRFAYGIRRHDGAIQALFEFLHAYVLRGCAERMGCEGGLIEWVS